MEKTKQSSEKLQKLSDGEQNMSSVDRLSALPDSVLCHILSFLPTKLSVATSILAGRWRFLWAHVPNLDFHCLDHHPGTSLTNIINKVMLQHKVQSINTFHLNYINNCSDYEFETWINAVIACNVHNISICLDYQLKLPQCLFTCKTLVDLRLNCCAIISLTGAPICLPSLKKIYLFCVDFDIGEDLPQLISGCPVLEKLTMERLVEDELVCCNIFSPTIRKLKLDFTYDCMGYSYSHDYRVKIQAPSLRYLQLTDSVSKHISAQMLTSLVEAYICLDYYKAVEEDDYYFLSVLIFVDSLCNVKWLNLSIGMVFPDGAFQSKSIIRFDNLTKLELAADWVFLVKFLKSADNLEVLIIRKVKECQKYWVDPKQVPTCLLSHLGTVRIDQFECTEPEFNMVRYLLRNAKVLERMEINSQLRGTDYKAKFNALKRISSFKRGSEECELVFH